MLELRLSVYEGADSVQWHAYLGDLPFHEQSGVLSELTCDLNEMLKSSCSDGIFCLFSCLCGFPVCNAYYVEVSHTENEVLWKRIYSADCGSIGKQIGKADWTFDRATYVNTIKKAMEISEMVRTTIIESEQAAPSNR